MKVRDKSPVASNQEYKHPFFLTLGFFDIKGDWLPEYCTRWLGLAKRVWYAPGRHIIESLKRSRHIGSFSTHRITGFRQHQLPKTLTILVIFQKLQMSPRHGPCQIKGFFHILENVAKASPTLESPYPHRPITNPSINRINKRKQVDLVITQ